MTRPPRRASEPGRVLMALARAIFDEETRASTVEPAIADLQHELREAGAHRMKRFLIRCRGTWAFWKLVAAVPISGARMSIDHGLGGFEANSSVAAGVRPLIALLAALLAMSWPVFTFFAVASLASGIVLAVAARWWHTRHPVDTASPSDRLRAEINFAAIPVAHNAGGIVCVAGSIAILLFGVPAFGWFLLATLAAGGLFAAALSTWRTAHPDAGVSTRSLLGRAA